MAHDPRPKLFDARRAIAPSLLVLTAAGALSLALIAREGSQTLSSAGSIPGMTVDEAPPRDMGLLITSLQTGSEAERDGVVAGDRVIAIDRHPVTSLREADRLVERAASRELKLEILHNRMRQDIVLRLQ